MLDGKIKWSVDGLRSGCHLLIEVHSLEKRNKFSHLSRPFLRAAAGIFSPNLLHHHCVDTDIKCTHIKWDQLWVRAAQTDACQRNSIKATPLFWGHKGWQNAIPPEVMVPAILFLYSFIPFCPQMCCVLLIIIFYWI